MRETVKMSNANYLCDCELKYTKHIVRHLRTKHRGIFIERNSKLYWPKSPRPTSPPASPSLSPPQAPSPVDVELSEISAAVAENQSLVRKYIITIGGEKKELIFV